MVRLLGLLLLLICFSGPAIAETVTGFAQTTEEVKRAMREWKFELVNISERNDKQYTPTGNPAHGTYRIKGKVFGAFVSCVPSNARLPIRYAYTYGESDRRRAVDKATYAFDAMKGSEGTCKPNSLTVLEDTQ